jgi:hypothetical protein
MTNGVRSGVSEYGENDHCCQRCALAKEWLRPAPRRHQCYSTKGGRVIVGLAFQPVAPPEEHRWLQAQGR